MFDIGFQELLLIGVLALLIMGPERLPSAVRTASLWIGRLRRSFQQIKTDIEREVGADEIRQQLHNESIMSSLEQTKNDLQQGLEQHSEHIKSDLEKFQQDANDAIETENKPHEPSNRS